MLERNKTQILSEMEKIAVKAVIKFKGKYLLQHRDKKKNIYSPNHWGLFGGMLNSLEKPKAGIKRELFEELGIKCQVKEKLLEIFHKESKTKNIFYKINPITVISIKNLKEGQGFQWFSLEEIYKKRKITWDTKKLFNILY